MSDRYYSTDFAEILDNNFQEVRAIIDAWGDHGLPDDFGTQGVTFNWNKNSGNVFLVNEDCDCAMINGSKLESHYSTPYKGVEGFFDDLVEEFSDMHREDQEYVRAIAERLGREDELPKEEEETEEEE